MSFPSSLPSVGSVDRSHYGNAPGGLGRSQRLRHSGRAGCVSGNRPRELVWTSTRRTPQRVDRSGDEVLNFRKLTQATGLLMHEPPLISKTREERK